MMQRIATLNEFIVGVLNRGQSLLLLAVRLYWGYQFAQSGWGKLHRLDGVAEYFGATLNLPMPHTTALVVSLIEFVGGILFALGLGSRLVSLVLFVNMSVAYWAADHEALTQIFSDPGKFYNADPYTFWFAALMVLVFGPGFFAIDTLLQRFFFPRKRASEYAMGAAS